jgi:hypothetical protein
MPSILSANTLSSGYDVANSLRFNSGSTDYLSITPSSASNRKTFTLSYWVKRSVLGLGVSGANKASFGVYENSSHNFQAMFNVDDQIEMKFKIGGANNKLQTNAKFRDISAWYHIVLAVDTTDGTAANRFKLYVNGVQVSSFDTASYPNQDVNTEVNLDGLEFRIGEDGNGGNDFDGYMAEICLIDGSQLTAASFGEFDEDSGIWKPINVSGLTFGTNGFYLEFKGSGTSANSSGLGADTSGNDHHFTVNNLTAVDQSTDTCTNNFCTINVLDNESGNITITEGNLNYTSTGGTDETNRGTFGFTKGKWYFESKFLDDNTYVDVGVGSASDSDIATPRFHMEMAGFYMLQIDSSSPGTRAFDNGSAGSGLGNSAVNDIHMFAIDMDNNKFYAGKNGTWYSSGDPANNANPLITMDDGYTTLMPSVCTKNDGAVSLNFGSPSYAISSGNADGDGYGNFEYAVPSGFFSLCTKNLAEHG